MKHNRYRKWESDGRQHYLMVHPSGLMLEIAFDTDTFGDKVQIYQSSRFNPLDEKVFLKYKESCYKYEWDHAKQKAIRYINGDMLMIELIKKKKS